MICFTSTQALRGPDDAHYRAYIASGRQVYTVNSPRSASLFQGDRGKEAVFIPELIQVSPVKE